jgi:hypothetical protein
MVTLEGATAKSPLPGFSRVSRGTVTRCWGSAGGVFGRL